MRLNSTHLYTCLLIFIGIGLSLTLYLQLQGVKQQNEKLYQHPFAVSNAAKSIEVNLLLISIEREQEGSRSKALTQEVLRDLQKIQKQYLGNTKDIESLERKIKTWLNNPKGIKDPSTHSIYASLSEIHTYARNKAKLFHDESQSIRFSFFLTILLLAAYFLACVSFVYLERIKKEKRLNRNLLNSKKRFEHLLNYTPNAVIIAAEDGSIIDSSAQASTLFGYSNSEFKTLKISDLIPNIHEQTESFIDSGSNIYLQRDRHNQTVLKNGELVDISLNVNIAAIDDEITTLASIRDIRDELAYKDKIFHQANYDFLTQLPNRSLAIDRF